MTLGAARLAAPKLDPFFACGETARDGLDYKFSLASSLQDAAPSGRLFSARLLLLLALDTQLRKEHTRVTPNSTLTLQQFNMTNGKGAGRSAMEASIYFAWQGSTACWLLSPISIGQHLPILNVPQSGHNCPDFVCVSRH